MGLSNYLDPTYNWGNPYRPIEGDSKSGSKPSYK